MVRRASWLYAPKGDGEGKLDQSNWRFDQALPEALQKMVVYEFTRSLCGWNGSNYGLTGRLGEGIPLTTVLRRS